MGRKKSHHKRFGFKAGHQYYNPGSKKPTCLTSELQTPKITLPRLTQDDHDLVVSTDQSGSPVLKDEEGRCTGGRILRPKRRLPDSTTSYLEGTGKGEYRIYNQGKLEVLWNTSIHNHNAARGNSCPDPQFTCNQEEKWGLCWGQSLKCMKCGFIGEKHKLYEEVMSNKRGRKSGQPNRALQIGLQECPMGNHKAHMLFTALNIPPPCPSALQKASNRTSSLTSELAEADLKARRSKLKDINKLRGLPENNPINVAVDVRYNSTTITGRSKLGQNASQAIGVAIEKHTDQQQIIDIHVENKLCYVGAWLRGRGFDVSCPAHADCSATIDNVQPFSEYNIGRRIGEKLASENILVKYITTDGDGRSCQGIGDSMAALDPTWEVVRQADMTHMGQSLFRHSMKAAYSTNMFSAVTSKEKRQQQLMFSLDLKYRCKEIYRVAHKVHSGNIDEISRRMPTIIETSIDCYAGNCDNCKKESLVCPGGKKNWRATSHYLQSSECMVLNVTENDKNILRELMRFYLGKESLQTMKLLSTTNKNESVNRSLSSCLPKIVNFARNTKARALSAVTRVNKGQGTMLVDMLEGAGCPISRGGAVAKAMCQVQKRHAYHRKYARRLEVKKAKRKRNINQMYKYMAAKHTQQLADYAKGQLDPPAPSYTSTRARDRSEKVGEHSYWASTEAKNRRLDHAYHCQEGQKRTSKARKRPNLKQFKKDSN